MQQHNPLSLEARAFADLKAKLAEAYGLEEDDGHERKHAVHNVPMTRRESVTDGVQVHAW